MSQYNLHPFTYDEEGKLHQLSNAKKAPSNAQGLLLIKYNNGLVAVRPSAIEVEGLISNVRYDAVENYIMPYDKNCYIIVLGHMIEALNVKKHIRNVRNEKNNVLGVPSSFETIVYAVIEYYRERFENRSFPVGAKTFLIDLNRQQIIAIAPDCQVSSSKCLLEGNFTTTEARQLLRKWSLLNDANEKVDDTRLIDLTTEKVDAMIAQSKGYDLQVRWKE